MASTALYATQVANFRATSTQSLLKEQCGKSLNPVKNFTTLLKLLLDLLLIIKSSSSLFSVTIHLLSSKSMIFDISVSEGERFFFQPGVVDSLLQQINISDTAKRKNGFFQKIFCTDGKDAASSR